VVAELAEHVIGADPDGDWMTAVVVVAKQKFPADSAGYHDALSWVADYTIEGERVRAVESTASYGRCLTAALARAGEWMVEFDLPREKGSTDGAKSNKLDAVRAALSRSNPSSALP
jgi:transposase